MQKKMHSTVSVWSILSLSFHGNLHDILNYPFVIYISWQSWVISTRLRLCCAFRQDDFPINFRQNVDDRTFSNFELEKGEIKVGHEIYKKNILTFKKKRSQFSKWSAIDIFDFFSHVKRRIFKF